MTKVSNYDLVYQDPTDLRIRAKMEVIAMVNKNLNLSIKDSITNEEAKEISLYYQKCPFGKHV